MSATHDYDAGVSTRRLATALALTSTFLVAELIGAYVFKSLALLSDAAHMFTDAAALAISLAAVQLGRKAADDQRSFGYRRFEILAAAFNALLLFAVAAYILYEGVLRLIKPEPVGTLGMLVVAAIGLAVNLVSMRLLAAGKEKSLNVKGAYLEVWADMLGSIGVIAGALIMMATGWRWVDPVIAIAIGLWVLPRTWSLLKDTTQILLEGVPQGMSMAGVRSAVAGVPGVSNVHDLHLWGISSQDANASLHIELVPGADGEAVRKAVTDLLESKFDIHHATVQTERDPEPTMASRHP
jgi:cobalt-zinc-cadmium efflux system protein